MSPFNPLGMSFIDYNYHQPQMTPGSILSLATTRTAPHRPASWGTDSNTASFGQEVMVIFYLSGELDASCFGSFRKGLDIDKGSQAFSISWKRISSDLEDKRVEGSQATK